MENEIAKRVNLLKKPVWTYKDIMEFDDTIKSPATAIKVKDRGIKEQNGGVSFGTKYVKVDSILALYGTSREQEIKLLKELLNEERKEITIL